MQSPYLTGTGTAFVARGSQWHRYGIRFKTPAKATSVVLKVGTLGRERATFFIDSVTLRPRLVQGTSKAHPKIPHTTPPTTSPSPPATTASAPAPTAPPTTATTTNTGATTTTVTPAAPTYASAIAYTATRPAFTVLREVDVASQAQLESAVANIKAGDRVKATAGFAVGGEFQISVNPSGPAEIDLGTGANAVRFSYSGTSELPSVWIVKASNLRIFGGDIQGPPPGQLGAGGVIIYKATNILWWGFHIHDSRNGARPGTGLRPDHRLRPAGRDRPLGENPANDPHAENGTGVHAANVADVTGGVYTSNRLALYAHDGPTGAAIQIGNPDATGQISGTRSFSRPST